MRKISIRFEEEFYHFLKSVEVSEFVEVFYNGLGLDPEQWLEEQEAELSEETRFSMFGMKVPLPEGLQNLQTWVCRLEERDEFVIFWVGDFAWHGWVQRWGCWKMYLRPLPDFPNLPSLSLAGCHALRDLDPLSGLQALTSLDLSHCGTLRDFSPLSGLPVLNHLNLSCCDSLNDLSPLSGLLALSSLNLGECVSLSDLSPLSGLPALKDLDLRFCDSLSDLSPLSGLQHLSSLDLGCCKFLNDLSPLRGITTLTSLDLTYCDYLRNLSPLSGLRALTSLNLTGWGSLIDLSPLSGLTDLTSLNFTHCYFLSDLGPLSGLRSLTRLDLSGCRSLKDLSPLSGLRALTSLKLEDCGSLKDLSPLSGLAALKDLSSCSSLSDLSPLRGLTSLTNLDLSVCDSLKDISPLSGLLALTSLKLRWCNSLGDLSPLSRLTALTSLDLSGCEFLSELSPLSGLQALSLLNLGECKSLRDLSPLSGLTVLRSLTFSSRRVRSIESLRGISSLRELSEFNPPEIAELLAHAAFRRSDRWYIRAQGKLWLEQARGWLSGPPDLQDRFAATLGDCFSLLRGGGSSLGMDYEAFLKSRPDFSVAPWKAWLGGTLRESGFDFYRRDLQWRSMRDLLPSMVGGVCATLPTEEAPTWSRHWLVELENARLADAKVLLRVAPEICLAHARLGEMAALGRWLAQLADPSDLAALDPVHAALAQFQFATGNSEAAENHLCAIQSPAHRDPVLAEWVTAMAERDLEQASAKLLRIETPALRADLAERLAAKAGASESTLQRLVVAVGDSPAALANLIHRLPDPGSKDFLRNISRTLQPSRQKTLLKVAEALRREADRLPAEPSVFTPNREL